MTRVPPAHKEAPGVEGGDAGTVGSPPPLPLTAPRFPAIPRPASTHRAPLTMREIVHLQAGQCGNQIGAKVRGLEAGGGGDEHLAALALGLPRIWVRGAGRGCPRPGAQSWMRSGGPRRAGCQARRGTKMGKGVGGGRVRPRARSWTDAQLAWSPPPSRTRAPFPRVFSAPSSRIWGRGSCSFTPPPLIFSLLPHPCPPR